MSRTVANDPLQKYKFRVLIPGLPSGMGFQKASGLSQETEVATYSEGGYDYDHKIRGRQKVGDVTLETGQFANKELQNLYEKSATDPNFRQTITIEQLDPTGKVARTWNLAEAWVSKIEYSDLDSTSSDVAIEKITIVHEYFL